MSEKQVLAVASVSAVPGRPWRSPGKCFASACRSENVANSPDLVKDGGRRVMERARCSRVVFGGQGSKPTISSGGCRVFWS